MKKCLLIKTSLINIKFLECINPYFIKQYKKEIMLINVHYVFVMFIMLINMRNFYVWIKKKTRFQKFWYLVSGQVIKNVVFLCA